MDESLLSFPAVLAYLEQVFKQVSEKQLTWELEKSSLLARITVLEAEKSGLENTKNDCIRRIKMLEFAIKKERENFQAEIQALKGGGGSSSSGTAGAAGAGTAAGSPAKNLNASTVIEPRTPNRDVIAQTHTARTKQILRKYLDEMGCTDALLSTPLRHTNNLLAMLDKSSSSSSPQSASSSAAAAAAAATTTPAARQTLDAASSNNNNNVTNSSGSLHGSNGAAADKKRREGAGGVGGGGSSGASHSSIPSTAPSEDGDSDNSSDSGDHTGRAGGAAGSGTSGASAAGAGDSAVGHHAQWKAKATLRSHFDAIRSVCFHNSEPLLFTASEDATVKLWALDCFSSQNNKKLAFNADLEPIFTFRGHTAPVFSVVVDSENRRCYTAGADMRVIGWKIPDANLDPYSSTGDDNHIASQLIGHTDAIWSLAMHPYQEMLLSAAADGTVRLWKPGNVASPLAQTYTLPEPGSAVPTSVSFLPSDPHKLIAGYTDGRLALFDAETATNLSTIVSADLAFSINKLSIDPSTGLVATAYDSQKFAVHDPVSNTTIHSMLAHTDCVSCVAFDPSGKYLATAGHDASVRFWSTSGWTCVQEISLHRKKYDESIHDIAYHPILSQLATAGADGTAKLLQ